MTASAVTPLLSNHQAPLRQQKGYSIIELSIALAIISIILVTALAGVQRILRSNSTNEDLKNINLLASKLTVMLSNVPTTAGIVQANLVNLRVFEGFRVNANVVTNAFNGNITVAPNTAQLGIGTLLRWFSMHNHLQTTPYSQRAASI
jgi:prepilin-type N-terminal cleavage/methylation domain-containing protein